MHKSENPRLQNILKRQLFGFQLRTWLISSIAGIIGLLALMLDLLMGGMVDDLLWHLTGETEPIPQLVGGLQYAANFSREHPDEGDTSNIQPIPENPFGINAFLELEAEATKRRQSMELIADAGFGWLRQQFAWEDIEIYGKGIFWDERNRDTNRVGGGPIRLDTYSSWEKYDHIVSLADEYGVNVLARISAPMPEWARPPGSTLAYGPPANTQDFVDFAVALAERYQGQIFHYQIWNEPNLYPEWGERLIDPEAYTNLLCRTHDALKAVDPNIIIHTGAIGPTINLSGRDAYDLLFLQRMYDFGAADCFDVLSAQGYGLFSGPTDRRMRPFTMNYARHEWLRDVMVANGDEDKPIWISEAGWNPVPNDPTIVGYDTYGQVSMDEAAEWAPIAYERAITEWPWVGVVNYWFLKRPHDLESGQAFYYFRLVEPTWETTPIYDSLQAYIQSGEWRSLDHDDAWEQRARERLPQVLIGGWAVLFLAFAFAHGLIKRFFPIEEI